MGDYDIQGNAIQETVWLDNLPVATIQNGMIYYIHTDHLGTPRNISDNSNMEVWRWDSDPFGVATANEDPDKDGQVFNYNLRFAGQFYDSETELNYNINRDCNTKTGKYIQSDSIGLNGGINTYIYASDSPINLVDPYGNKSTDPSCGDEDECHTIYIITIPRSQEACEPCRARNGTIRIRNCSPYLAIRRPRCECNMVIGVRG